MKSYTTLRNLFGSMVNQNDTATLTLGDQLINDSIRTVYNLRGGKWWFLEETTDILTVASQRAYQVPNKFRKIQDVYTTVGSTIYMPEPVFDPYHWKLILAYQLGTSDTPYFYYREGNKLLFAPIPATNGNVITVRGRFQPADLNQADYTTGTITAVTSGATTLTGSGTSWNSSMEGRYIRITQANTANSGDEEWYEIATVNSTTSLDLVKNYEGDSIVAGSATYIIGQMSRIPEAYDVAPVYRAVAQYWDTQGNLNLSSRYWKLYDGGYEMGQTKIYGGLIGQMIENEGETMEGAYIPPFASTANIVNTGAWWSPWQGDASGF